LYVCGLNGWQTAARRDGCVQRVRATGQPCQLPTAFAAEVGGLRLRFPNPLDPATAGDAASYRVEQWNYHWSGEYGSKRWSVAEPSRTGQDVLTVKSATLAADGQS